MEFYFTFSVGTLSLGELERTIISAALIPYIKP